MWETGKKGAGRERRKRARGRGATLTKIKDEKNIYTMTNKKEEFENWREWQEMIGRQAKIRRWKDEDFATKTIRKSKLA